MRQRVYIYAGSQQQAVWLAAALTLPKSNWIYLCSGEELRGTDGATILRFGTWWDRPAIERDRIRTIATVNHSHILDVSDR